MTNFKIGGIVHFIFIIISFLILFITISNITKQQKNFDFVSNYKVFFGLLTDYPELQEYKVGKTVQIQEVRMMDIESLKKMKDLKNLHLDKNPLGKFVFVTEESFGIYNLYKDKIIYIKRNFKVSIETQKVSRITV